MKNFVNYTLTILCVISICCNIVQSSGDESAETKKKAKRKLPKDPLYITDLDIENLYEEWEESDDEKLPPDELPAHLRPKPQFKKDEYDKLMKNPDELMRASKKGQTVMAFVTVANNPSKEETELLTQRWQIGLVNMHMKCERFVISDDRAIFVFEDGSLAFEAVDYLTSQPEVKEYSIDNRSWHGKGYPVEYPNAEKKDANPTKDAKQSTEKVIHDTTEKKEKEKQQVKDEL